MNRWLIGFYFNDSIQVLIESWRLDGISSRRRSSRKIGLRRICKMGLGSHSRNLHAIQGGILIKSGNETGVGPQYLYNIGLRRTDRINSEVSPVFRCSTKKQKGRINGLNIHPSLGLWISKEIFSIPRSYQNGAFRSERLSHQASSRQLWT